MKNSRILNLLLLAIVSLTLFISSCIEEKVKLNSAPGEITLTTPYNEAVDIELDAVLSWHSVSDPDGDAVTYNVYFGTEPAPANTISNGQSGTTYTPMLEANTTYYWKVVAKDPNESSSESPVWSFSTVRNDQEELKDLTIYNISQESDWDFWIIGKTGDYLLIEEMNSIPYTIFFKPGSNNDGYSIFLGSSGLPNKAVIGDYVFLFGNFNEFKMDITILYPDGTLETIEAVETSYNWNNISLTGARITEDKIDQIRWAGQMVDGIACGLSFAIDASMGSLSISSAAIGCEAAVVALTINLLSEEYEVLGFSESTFGPLATIFDCGQSSVLQCGLDLLTLAFATALEGIELINSENYIEIENIKYPLNLGYYVWFSELDCGELDVFAHGLYLSFDITTFKYVHDEWASLLSSGKGNRIIYNMYSKSADLVAGQYNFVDKIDCYGMVTDEGEMYQMSSTDKFVTSISEVDESTGYVLNVDLDIDWSVEDIDNPSADAINKYLNYFSSKVGISEGSVAVNIIGNIYRITFDCTDANGKAFTGKFTGYLEPVEFGV